MESLLVQRKARNLCISGAAALQLATVKKKFPGSHRPEFRCRQTGQFLLQTLKDAIRAIPLLPPWRAGNAASARQSEVRTECAIFPRNAEGSSSPINRFR